jgi:hypothetical protein
VSTEYYIIILKDLICDCLLYSVFRTESSVKKKRGGATGVTALDGMPTLPVSGAALTVGLHSSTAAVPSTKEPQGRSKSAAKKKTGGRERLPDKLLKYLNEEPLPGVIWWMQDGNGFALCCETIQAGLLDPFFKGTKLTSFVRSLNRWYVQYIQLLSLQ